MGLTPLRTRPDPRLTSTFPSPTLTPKTAYQPTSPRPVACWNPPQPATCRGRQRDGRHVRPPPPSASVRSDSCTRLALHGDVERGRGPRCAAEAQPLARERGTTSSKIMRLLRDASEREVNTRITSSPVVAPTSTTSTRQARVSSYPTRWTWVACAGSLGEADERTWR